MYRKLFLSLFIVVAIFSGLAHAGALSTYKISFKTMACDGTKGLASIDADTIVKVESIKCENGEKFKEVYQVLVTGEPGSGLTYRVFTTTEAEAERILKKVDAYQDDKRKSIKEGNRIIID